MSARLEAVRRRFPWMKVVRAVEHARTNQVYAVQWHGEEAFLRLRSAEDRVGRLDESSELRCMASAGDRSPSVLHHEPGLLVTASVGEVRPTPQALGRALADVHNRPPPTLRRLSMKGLLSSLELEGDLSHLRALKRALVDQLTPVELCFCHHDVHDENVRQTPFGVVFLDWEYAAIGDPRFDLFCAMRIFGGVGSPGAEALYAAYQQAGGPGPMPGPVVAQAVGLVDTHWELRRSTLLDRNPSS